MTIQGVAREVSARKNDKKKKKMSIAEKIAQSFFLLVIPHVDFVYYFIPQVYPLYILRKPNSDSLEKEHAGSEFYNNIGLILKKFERGLKKLVCEKKKKKS